MCSAEQLGWTRAWLQFQAINYSAEVFLNGHQHCLPGGMFLRHTIDVTDWLNSDEPNKLAVIVHPPDHPGKIPPEGGQGGDHDVGAHPMLQAGKCFYAQERHAGDYLLMFSHVFIVGCSDCEGRCSSVCGRMGLDHSYPVLLFLSCIPIRYKCSSEIHAHQSTTQPHDLLLAETGIQVFGMRCPSPSPG